MKCYFFPSLLISLISSFVFFCPFGCRCILFLLKITINLFLFFCIFGDVVSQLAQTYLPYCMTTTPSSAATAAVDSSTTPADTTQDSTVSKLEKRGPMKMTLLLRKIFLIGCGVGVINSAATQLLQRFGHQVRSFVQIHFY